MKVRLLALVKLAICLSHFIQYKAPLLSMLADVPEIDLCVYYYSEMGLKEKIDKNKNKIVAWDVPLTRGYRYKILRNWLDESKWKFRSIQPYLNPGIIFELIKNKVDIVMIHSYQYPTDWMAFFTAKLLKRKILFYGDVFPAIKPSLSRRLYRRIIHRKMIRNSDACLAIGSVAASVYENEFDVKPEQIFLAPYAVDNSFFQDKCSNCRRYKQKIKQEFGISDDELVILCVARMVSKKRHKDLIDAMREQTIKARLILIGHGPLLNELITYCEAVLPTVIFTGFKNQNEIVQYYAIADIFVLASEFEEYGLVVNEAMNCGLPIIASSGIASTYDLLIEKQNGFRFLPGDVTQLAAYIHYLLANKGDRVEFGKKSVEIINNWSYDQTIQGIIKAVNSVVCSCS